MTHSRRLLKNTPTLQETYQYQIVDYLVPEVCIMHTYTKQEPTMNMFRKHQPSAKRAPPLVAFSMGMPSIPSSQDVEIGEIVITTPTTTTAAVVTGAKSIVAIRNQNKDKDKDMQGTPSTAVWFLESNPFMVFLSGYGRAIFNIVVVIVIGLRFSPPFCFYVAWLASQALLKLWHYVFDCMTADEGVVAY